MIQITIGSNDMMGSILPVERHFFPMAKKQLRVRLKLKWRKRRYQ